MKALFTGATGFIGSCLMSRVEQRVVLTRNVAAAQKKLAEFNPQVYAWNAEKEPAPMSAFAGVQTIFHLAGEPVAEGRWTDAKKRRLRDSRILGTRNLVETLRQLNDKPKVLVAASAVGIYGDRGEEILQENASSANDFLADLCRDWEAEAHTATSLGIRVVSIRIGIVLGNGGGALQKMLTPFRLGVGSALGSGKQYMPWIHLHDLADLFVYAAEHESLMGPVNGTSPNPVSNYEFTKTLGKTLGMPTFFPAVPGFALKLMFGEFGNILLHSQRVMPHKALNAGFQFRYSELAPALVNILAK
jgi:uncharacterized protein